MHAWLCENPVGVDALTWKELPTPQPGKGQVLIRIQAASLNFPDLLIVQNKYQHKPELPFVPGSEYAGVVEAVGEGVTDLKVGQAVACLSGTCGFGTHALAPAKLCMPRPPGFPPGDAAAFIMIYATSHHALMDRGQLKAGETVLVLGAAGGVGMSAIQIAKIAGAKVIAAASTDEKCAFCKQLGADETLNYSNEDLRERLEKTPLNDEAREKAEKELATASAGRLTQIALIWHLAKWEANTTRDTWRRPQSADRAVLAALRDWGYKLSDVEAEVADGSA